ncbi:hypothetical protein MMC07_001189 [Pseudocyphellaria aurata]|nr:hypothetical protein [Pseudocyphellaria aurata]
MKSALVLLALAQAQAVFGASTTTCNADNCARAVTGTRYPAPIQSDHKADCSSFLRTTITPATSTVTVTVTNPPVNNKRDDEGILVARQATQTPSAVPSYASACSGTARYSSACSCAGVTRATTFAPTPTTTVTATVTATGRTSPLYPMQHLRSASLTMSKLVRAPRFNAKANAKTSASITRIAELAAKLPPTGLGSAVPERLAHRSPTAMLTTIAPSERSARPELAVDATYAWDRKGVTPGSGFSSGRYLDGKPGAATGPMEIRHFSKGRREM